MEKFGPTPEYPNSLALISKEHILTFLTYLEKAYSHLSPLVEVHRQACHMSIPNQDR